MANGTMRMVKASLKKYDTFKGDAGVATPLMVGFTNFGCHASPRCSIIDSDLNQLDNTLSKTFVLLDSVASNLFGKVHPFVTIH